MLNLSLVSSYFQPAEGEKYLLKYLKYQEFFSKFRYILPLLEKTVLEMRGCEKYETVIFTERDTYSRKPLDVAADERRGATVVSS